MKNSIGISENQFSSIWWRRGLFFILFVEFAVLIWITTGSYYRDSQPPIPEKVIDNTGLVVFTGIDIQAGQEVFLQKGLMNNGSIWGHGAYLGPDFSAQYLHNLALEVNNYIAIEKYKTKISEEPGQKESLVGLTGEFLATNRYDAESQNLIFTEPEVNSFNAQISYWKDYFQNPAASRGLPNDLISDPQEMRQLTAFFAWAAWASVAHSPGNKYSYTN
ncbi:MAG: hypothetical protein U1D64_01285, partial [Bacteroidales bacterium]|nr:hypothetical protein [Bacteroidales bacterium]